jgi:hypothetical protein
MRVYLSLDDKRIRELYEQGVLVPDSTNRSQSGPCVTVSGKSN